MGRHWITLSTPQNGARRHRTYAQEMFYQPLLSFSAIDTTFDSYSRNFKTLVK